MNKTKILWIILESVFLAAFLIFFFVLSGARHNTAVWIGFASIILSYFALLAIPSFVRSGKRETDYRRPLYVISALYFLAAFLFNLGVLFARPETYKTVLLINIALLGLYLICLIANLLANEDTADQQEKREEELQYVKVVPARLKIIADSIRNPELSRKLTDTAEMISISPARSTTSVRSMERRILEEVEKLENREIADETGMFGSAELIMSLARNRNRILNTEN